MEEERRRIIDSLRLDWDPGVGTFDQEGVSPKLLLRELLELVRGEFDGDGVGSSVC